MKALTAAGKTNGKGGLMGKSGMMGGGSVQGVDPQIAMKQDMAGSQIPNVPLLPINQPIPQMPLQQMPQQQHMGFTGMQQLAPPQQQQQAQINAPQMNFSPPKQDWYQKALSDFLRQDNARGLMQ